MKIGEHMKNAANRKRASEVFKKYYSNPENRKNHLGGKLFKKGQIPWNKNKKYSLPSRPNQKGKQFGTPFKKGQVPWNKGKIFKTKEEKRTVARFAVHRRRMLLKNIEGSHTIEEWIKLIQLCANTCVSCLRMFALDKLTEDHIIPISKKGPDYIWNIQPMCQRCNSIKHTKIIKFIGMERNMREQYIQQHVNNIKA